MNDILKLYYYGLKINKKKFMLIGGLICVWIILSISVSMFSVSSIGKVSFVGSFFKDFYQAKPLPMASMDRFNKIISSSILLRDTASFAMYSFIGFVTLLSVLMSFLLVTDDYKRKNSSYLIMANLPTKIYKVKISKILVGWSIYIFCIVGFSLAALLMDAIWKLYLGDMYMMSAWSLLGDDSFLLTSSYSAIIISLVVVLPSVMGIQALTSIFFVSNDRGKVLKKIICVVLLMINGIGVFVFVVSYMFNYNIFNNYSELSVVTWFAMAIYIVSLTLTYVDCRLSQKRTRGGVING